MTAKVDLRGRLVIDAEAAFVIPPSVILSPEQFNKLLRHTDRTVPVYRYRDKERGTTQLIMFLPGGLTVVTEVKE